MALKLSEGRKPNSTNKHSPLPMGHLTRLPHVGYFQKHNFVYLVTRSGRVFSLTGQYRNREMRQWDNGHGYKSVRLCGRKRVVKYVHRLVAECFIPNPNNLPEVNHKNANKADNRVENLEWVTRHDNQKHMYESELHPVGFEKSCRDHIVQNLHKAGLDRKKIGKLVGVGEWTVHKRLSRKGLKSISARQVRQPKWKKYEADVLVLAKKKVHMSEIARRLGVSIHIVRFVRDAHPEVSFLWGRGLYRHLPTWPK